LSIDAADNDTVVISGNFVNSGDVDVNSGTLALQGTLDLTNSYDITLGAILSLQGNHIVTTGTTLSGSGTVVFSGQADVSIAGSVSITVDAVLQDGTTIAVSGAGGANLKFAQTSISAGAGTVSIQGDIVVDFSQATSFVSGEVSLEGGALVIISGTLTVDNQANVTFSSNSGGIVNITGEVLASNVSEINFNTDFNIDGGDITASDDGIILIGGEGVCTLNGINQIDLGATDGGFLIITGPFNLQSCLINGANGTVIFAGTAQASLVADATYTVGSIVCAGDSIIQTGGSVTLLGQLTLQNNAQFSVTAESTIQGSIVAVGASTLRVAQVSFTAPSASIEKGATYVFEQGADTAAALTVTGDVTLAGSLEVLLSTAGNGGAEVPVLFYTTRAGKFDKLKVTKQKRQQGDGFEVQYNDKEGTASIITFDAGSSSSSGSTIVASVAVVFAVMALFF